MGVKSLWTILSGAGEMVDLRELQGKRVAVDLAGWIVESNLCRGISGKVNRPHLRNVFFRAAALQALHIYPVFVFDGEAPALKQQTLNQRRAAEQGLTQSQTQSAEPVKLSRNRLKSVMGECRALLQALGFECVVSSGEAEALCAQLNCEGLVDAIITEDSDAFCYGAVTVLRNFSIVASGSSVELYSLKKIENLLSLTRDRFILMAVLLGCDFFPTGIPGIGKELIHQLFATWPKYWSSIDAFKIWSKRGFPFDDKKLKKGCGYKCDQCLFYDNEDSKEEHCLDCQDWMETVSKGDCHCKLLADNIELVKVENAIRKKCSGIDKAWWSTQFLDILKEFLSGQRLPDLRKTSESHEPNFDQSVSLLVKKLSWTEDYAVEKMIPLLTRWYIKNTTENFPQRVIQPLRLKKKRVKDGNPSFDILWKSMDENSKYLPNEFESCEPVLYIQKSYPDLILEFEEQIKPKKKPSKTKINSGDTQQPAITKFFAQGKTKQPSKSTEKCLDDPTSKKPQPILKTILTNKVVEKFSRLDRVVVTPESSPLVHHRDIARVQLSAMSVDLSNDTWDSDLSMVIDDFLAKGSRTHLGAVQSSAPVTSTPHIRNNRGQNLETVTNLMRKVEQDLSMMSVCDLEDTFDRMCK